MEYFYNVLLVFFLPKGSEINYFECSFCISFVCQSVFCHSKTFILFSSHFPFPVCSALLWIQSRAAVTLVSDFCSFMLSFAQSTCSTLCFLAKPQNDKCDQHVRIHLQNSNDGDDTVTVSVKMPSQHLNITLMLWGAITVCVFACHVYVRARLSHYFP